IDGIIAGRRRLLLVVHDEICPRQGPVPGTRRKSNPIDIVLPTFSPVFPNPVAGPAEVALDLIRNTRVSIDLLDLSGRQLKEIYRGRISAGEHSIALGDLSEYPPGSYLLALRTSEGHQSISLIIK
ncbi:MAG: hypothetical protein AAFN65_09810, partial [Bacteroidota bacterium]